MARYYLRLGDREVDAELEETNEGIRLNIDGEWRVAGLRRIGDSPRYLLTLDDRVIEVLVEEEPLAFNVTIAGRAYEVETARRRGMRRRDEGDAFVDGRWRLLAPLTGVVNEVRVAAGDTVENGDILIIVEAMKMLNELRARLPGVVNEVLVAERDRVEIGQPLIELRES